MTDPGKDTVAGRTYLALRALAKAQGRSTAELLQLYVLERFVARVAVSPESEHLVLKGGLLMAAFGGRRPTRDVDLLALGLSNDPNAVRECIGSIAALDLGDGVVFDPTSLRARVIREGGTYTGVRVRALARLATARQTLHVDVTVGDPVEPPPQLTCLPALLAEEPVRLLAYPPEMVVAEKLTTALERGGTNTRWRDFVDLHLLAQNATDEDLLVRALRRVATHRGVPLHGFEAVRRELGPNAQPKWSAWRKKEGLDDLVPESLDHLLETLEPWATRLLREAASD